MGADLIRMALAYWYVLGFNDDLARMMQPGQNLCQVYLFMKLSISPNAALL